MGSESMIVRSPKVLVINPNTNANLTQDMTAQIEAIKSDGLYVQVTNPETGPYSIETPSDRCRAVDAVMKIIRQCPAFDAYVLACFDDIAVEEARELVSGSVFSIAEAAIRSVAYTGQRYSIITTVDEQVPTIKGLINTHDSGKLGVVRACGVGVAAAFEQMDHAEAQLDMQILQAIDVDGSQSIVLGSGAYAGRSHELSERYGIRVVDGMVSAFENLSKKLIVP